MKYEPENRLHEMQEVLKIAFHNKWIAICCFRLRRKNE